MHTATLPIISLPPDALFGRRALKTGSQLSSSVAGDGDVCLSLRSARRLDCGGVAFLLRAYSQLASQGRRLFLVDVAPSVRDALESLGWRDVFVPETSPVTLATVNA
jgi:anti-anti-sigma regulatory factor